MKFAEIRHTYVWGPAVEKGAIYNEQGDLLAAVSIDTWKTDRNDEDGAVAANVILTRHGDIVVDFHDNGLRGHKQVLEHVNAAKEELKQIWASHAAELRKANRYMSSITGDIEIFRAL